MPMSERLSGWQEHSGRENAAWLNRVRRQFAADLAEKARDHGVAEHASGHYAQHPNSQHRRSCDSPEETCSGAMRGAAASKTKQRAHESPTTPPITTSINVSTNFPPISDRRARRPKWDAPPVLRLWQRVERSIVIHSTRSRWG